MKKTIQSTRGAVRFSLKHSKNYLIQNRHVTSPIFLWFSYKGTRVKKSIGYSVLLEDWDFNRDIYHSIGNEIGMSREGVKDQFKLYINYADKHKRINVELIKHLEKRYKEVSQLIQYLSNLNYFKSPLSYLIQRCESYLFLLHGCKSLSRNKIPYLTIHDSVMCHEDKKLEVQFLLTNTINNLTGLRPGIKFKELDNPFLTLNETSEKIVESINSES